MELITRASTWRLQSFGLNWSQIIFSSQWNKYCGRSISSMYVNIPQLIRLLRNSTVNIIYVDVMLTQFVPRSQGETERVVLYLMLVVSVRGSKEWAIMLQSKIIKTWNGPYRIIRKYSACLSRYSVIQLRSFMGVVEKVNHIFVMPWCRDFRDWINVPAVKMISKGVKDLDRCGIATCPLPPSNKNGTEHPRMYWRTFLVITKLHRNRWKLEMIAYWSRETLKMSGKAQWIKDG